MQEVFKKIVEKLEERTSFLSYCTKYGNKDAEQQNKSYSTMMMYEVADLVDDLIEIVKQEAEKFGRDTNVESKGNDVLEFANLLKELCCKKDEDYDNPVISPKYLNDTIENLLLDFNEQYNNGWIPCSELMPEKEGKYLVTLDKWNIVSFADFKNLKYNPHFNAPVIAWQPLPEPYKPKGE